MEGASPSASGARGRRLLRRRNLLALWLALLVPTWVLMALRRDEPQLGPDEKRIELAAVAGETLGPERVLQAWRERAAAEPGDRPALLLLHGSPGSRHDFDRLLEALSPRWRVVAPDLVGFGKSSRRAPDYSVRAHARYALALLEALGIQRAHVLGFSMGGGVAIELADLAPERVGSLTLLSAIGVQELELFGDHRLNHLVHAAQLGIVQLVRFCFPHLGAMEDAFLGHPYARNFFDTDQRPLRAKLERYAGPMLIVHGERDFLVPAAAAREHHRIVPQSVLHELPQGHFVLWQSAPEIARILEGFLASVENGRATTRASARPERVARAAQPFDPRGVPPMRGPALLLLALLIVAGTLISEDLTCIGAGLLVAHGRVEFLPAAAACFAGIYLGDMLLFAAGRFVGRPALAYPPLRWMVTPARLEMASLWFRSRGLKAVFVTRLLPGLRLPIYFAAGLLQTRFLRFAGYFFVAAAFWTPLLVGFSAWAGLEADRTLALFERATLPLFLALVLAIFVVERIVLRLFTHRGRRQLVGAWMRLRHFEFWPPWAFYPPIVLHVAWLALRHRSLALVTAVNPGIPTGGFIGESKSAILDGLAGAGERVARHRLIRAAEPAARRIELAHEFQRAEGLRFPIVLKPDVGQRGSGVHIVEDEERLRSLLESTTLDLIVQEYVPGREFGVFYYRMPDEEHGRIFSITEKRIPEVEGDGESTLEELILEDERAVCMAPVYSRTLGARMAEVPAAGERVQLVRIGTHCRGAIFLDGSWVATPELEREIDRISRSFEGFYFGRYDLRASSAEELREGRGFKILELNGLTSEATHIYDPRLGLLHAWRVLREQWSIAFAIARANHARGARPAPLSELWRELRAFRRTKAAHLA